MDVKQEIPAGEFKTRCLALLDEVAETGREIIVTKRGKPVAKLAPLTPKSLKGSIKFIGDILSPVVDPDDWDANRD
jgi:prevent-host-death family protein